MEIQKILVVCLANINRSPVLAALLKTKLSEVGLSHIMVESGAMYDRHIGHSANQIAVRLLAEQGIDISQHQSKWIGEFDLKEFQLIVCMENYQRCEIQKITGEDSPKIVVTHIGDPYWDEETVRKYVPLLSRAAEMIIYDYIKPSS